MFGPGRAGLKCRHCARATRACASDTTEASSELHKRATSASQIDKSSARPLSSSILEHEGGLVKPSSLSALAAAEAIAKENKVSLLLAGSGPTLHKAAEHAASSTEGRSGGTSS